MENPVAISPHFMILRLKLSFGYLTVLSAYALTLAATSEEKNVFCNHRSRSIRLIWPGNHITFASDLNGCVGSDLFFSLLRHCGH